MCKRVQNLFSACSIRKLHLTAKQIFSGLLMLPLDVYSANKTLSLQHFGIILIE